MCSMRNELSRDFNESGWIFKVGAIIGMFIVLLWVPNLYFGYYQTFAKFVSGLFLLFQIIMIIDLCYIWGEKWMEIYEEGN